ncbi:glycosyltransferase family A protein [Nodularia sphaerocarpa]|uniref:glycosyltransferase family A protein n=1 Tax=Nodularia sphaerocarpa TaxID=137816 RepID=UPI001EFB2C9F|nr:glycosyltransferase family A protein [Nodularia sphaerocarpa]MDB9374347.1 glycosyltransferase family A protein [Nodularia sphaerocarpa CS-585]MDB9379248.1 glycosyltransferase family A protein [Nodularia sphaerocarpa CS-585A2]ULP70395.1 hypothetical protein BDGGKGIB_00011 [Nodularia sphaerocarpa UHCC 0038]
MLTFIIPVKSRKVTKSWEILSKLFERTVKSVCNQTSPNFRVVVVCNEKPNIQFEHPHVHYVEVDFLPFDIATAEEKQLEGYAYAASSDIANRNADKARRILVGIDYASKFEPSHIMVVDADDCVNRYLAEYVQQHQKCAGWVFKKGYMYQEKSKFIYLNRKNFHQISGTSIIIRSDLINLLFTKTTFYNHLTDDSNLQPLPFPGALYSMGNGENILASNAIISQMKNATLKGGIVKIIEKISKYRILFVSPAITNDFGLYNLSF